MNEKRTYTNVEVNDNIQDIRTHLDEDFTLCPTCRKKLELTRVVLVAITKSQYEEASCQWCYCVNSFTAYVDNIDLQYQLDDSKRYGAGKETRSVFDELPR